MSSDLFMQKSYEYLKLLLNEKSSNKMSAQLIKKNIHLETSINTTSKNNLLKKGICFVGKLFIFFSKKWTIQI